MQGLRYGDGNSQICAWKKMEGVIGDRHIPRKLKGKVFGSCATPPYLHPVYGLETMAMTEKQQEK